MPPTYATSRDYDLFLQLMPTHRLVCFVDQGRGKRDVCQTKYEPPSKYENGTHPWFKIANCYQTYLLGRWSTKDVITFCRERDLEFILPACAVNPVTNVNPVPLQPSQYECCFCNTSDPPLMDIGTPSVDFEGEIVPVFCYAEAWMLAGKTTALHSCRPCFEKNAMLGPWITPTVKPPAA